MAKIYYDLIKIGKWDIERVPAIWKQQTLDLLAKDE